MRINLLNQIKKLLFCLVFVFVGPVFSQPYPSKPIKIIIPYVAGGPADVMIRAISQKLSDSWGQPFLVDNKPGANEIIGADIVAKSPGDGYTFLVASDATFSLNQNLYTKLPYDPVKDLVPVTKLVIGNLMLVVRPDFPANNIAEFIEYAKKNPGKLNYATIGSGSVNHLTSAWFNSLNGLQMEHIPFKGIPPAVQEIVASRVDSMFAITGGVAPFVESGKLKGLGVAGKNRQPVAPKVPTFAELGYSNFDATYYIGIAAPKGTPTEILSRLAKDMNAIVNEDEFKSKYLQPLGFDALGDTPEQFASFLKSDRQIAAQKVKISGAKLD
jgi:tripartite-type tricarboxylate transporter receptor subunit TctC